MTEDDPVRFAKVYPHHFPSHASLLRMKFESILASELLYPPTIAVIKISTLLLYARIFHGQTFKYVLWAVGLFISTYSAVLMIVMLLQCSPLSKFWDHTVNGKCFDIAKVWMVMGSLNVLTDLLLLILPLPSLWRLQMRRRTKVQVAGIFSIGSLSVTRSRKFSNGLTGGLRPTDSLSFRSIESRR